MADGLAFRFKRSAVQLAGYGQQRWTSTVPAGLTPEDVMQPEAWSDNAARFKLGDEIVLIAEDLSYRLHLIVLDRGEHWAKMATVSLIRFGAAAERMPADPGIAFYVRHKGGPRWGVVRAKDKAWIRDDFLSKDAAQAFIDNGLAMTDARVAA